MRHHRLIKNALACLLAGLSAHAAYAQTPSRAIGMQSQARVGISLSIAPRFILAPVPGLSPALSLNSERLRFTVQTIDPQANSARTDGDLTSKSVTQGRLMIVVPD